MSDIEDLLYLNNDDFKKNILNSTLFYPCTGFDFYFPIK